MKKIVVFLVLLSMIICFGPIMSRAYADLSKAPDGFDIFDLSWKETPDSTALEAIAYDSKYHVLGVIFKSNTTRAYLYYDVPKSEWNDFKAADSLGGYYNSNIKGYYSSERVDLFELEMQERERTSKRVEIGNKVHLIILFVIIGGVIVFCVYTKIDEARMDMVEKHKKS